MTPTETWTDEQVPLDRRRQLLREEIERIARRSAGGRPVGERHGMQQRDAGAARRKLPGDHAS